MGAFVVSWNQAASLTSESLGSTSRAVIIWGHRNLIGCSVRAFSISSRIPMAELLGRPPAAIAKGRWGYHERSRVGFDPDGAELAWGPAACPWTSYFISLGQLTSPLSPNDSFFCSFVFEMIKKWQQNRHMVEYTVAFVTYEKFWSFDLEVDESCLTSIYAWITAYWETL